jgi:hypothetical protein
MMSKLIIFHFIFFVYVAKLYAQGDIEILKSGISATANYVRTNNSAELGNKNANGISYSEVGGSPFWNAEWKSAILYCAQSRSFSLDRVKLNLYSGDVHYIDKEGKEMVATDIVERIVFYNGADTNSIAAVFEKYPLDGATTTTVFYEVLNEGKTALLKLNGVTLDSRLDPLAGKTINKFVARSGYYISTSQKPIPVKKLDKENILGHIKNGPGIQDWLKANKNSLKNESQVIDFLIYYNELN